MNKGNQKVNLRPIWDALLEVYKVFVDICERHGLRYCADSGTALGAVRHGGFIPWDDDMDIQMPRPDYEKFIEIAKRELPKGYAWLDREVCPVYDNGFGKVVITDEVRVNRVAQASGCTLGQGLFIDVFPLDGYPNSWIERKWRKVQNILIGFRAKYNAGWNSNITLKGKIAYLIGAVLLPFNYRIHNYREQVEFYEKRAKQYPFGSTKMCVSIGTSQYSDDKPYELEYFGILKKVSFDRVKIPVQENVDGYLRATFGDYMQLPPESARHPTHSNTEIVPWWPLHL
ncbi:MAG: LicD family protein [Kiritimatiellae bacterium]|nr:LicD family protein [Kiritimatiellia bacterium]